MAGLRVHFVMSRELVERIDAALVDGQSRGEFVRRAVERALGEATAQGSRSVEATAPAPAEQPRVQQSYLSRGSQRVPGPNVENVRSSGQAKRDVRPVPKGGKS